MTTYTLKILVHKFVVGSIIGKAGAIIREIQVCTKSISPARKMLLNDIGAQCAHSFNILAGIHRGARVAVDRVRRYVHREDNRDHGTYATPVILISLACQLSLRHLFAQSRLSNIPNL
jgi:hypothetical protein